MDVDTFQRVVADVAATVHKCSTTLNSRQLDEIDSQLDVYALARDVGTLIHSHCTKLAIAARPPKTQAAIDACLAEIAKIIPALAALSQNCHTGVQGVATCRAVARCCKYVLSGLADLAKVVSDRETNDARLAQTGILYESCDELKGLAADHKLVARKVQECSLMVADAIEDLQSWLEGGDDDDFGLNELSDDDDDDDDNDDNDDNDNDDHDLNTATNGLSLQEKAEGKTAAEEEDTKRRIVMLERIKILLKAIQTKRLSAELTVTLRNRIYTDAEELVAEIDEMAGEVQDRRSDEHFILELEKAVVHRVEALLTATSGDDADDKWRKWIDLFKTRWREHVPKSQVGPPTQADQDGDDK